MRHLAAIFLSAFVILHSTFAADIIPSSRRVDWIPQVTVGYRGTHPTHTNILDFTLYGGTTNKATNTGTIATGSSTLTLSTATGWAVSNGVLVSGQSLMITNLSGTTAILNGTVTLGVTNGTIKHDNSPPLNNMVNFLTRTNVIYFPPGTYTFRSGINLDSANFTWRGSNAANTVAAIVSGPGLTIGPTLNPTGKSYNVTSTPFKGTNQLTLNPATNLVVGEMYRISTLNGTDTNRLIISPAGVQRTRFQPILVTAISGSNVTFTPPLVDDFTNTPFLLQTLPTGLAKTNIGIENLSITFTNAGEGNSGAVEMMHLSCLADYWVEGCRFLFANNYNLHPDWNVHGDIRSNIFAHSLDPAGTSHSGVLIESSAGLLFENNLIDDFQFGVQWWGGGNGGNVLFGNVLTNITANAIFDHSSHNQKNLYEQNVMAGNLTLSDGYYGSHEFSTVNGNRIYGTIATKRWSRFQSFTGNILGTYWFDFNYDRFDNALSTYSLFELGNPNIGNVDSTGTNPPMSWNYPQTSWFGRHGSNGIDQRAFSNLSYTFTSNWTGSNIVIGSQATNWPFDASGEYTIMWQDGSNTNLYHYASDTVHPINQINTTVTLAQRPYDYLTSTNNGIVIVGVTNNPPVTNLVFNRTVTVSNGWTMMVSSPDAFQQRQDADATSYIRHGNGVYTNQSTNMGIVWDSGIAETNITRSYLYTNTLPAFLIGGQRVSITNPLTTNRLYWEAFYVDTSIPNTNPPVASFFASPTNGTRPLSVGFQSGSGTNAVLWDFGNGVTSTNPTPTVLYSNAGSFTVTMIASNAYGATTSSILNYIVVTNSSLPATGTWVDALPIASATSTSFWFAGSAIWQKLTNTVTGTATALRTGALGVGSIIHVKCGIYNAASNYLADGSGTFYQDGYNEIPLVTPTRVTNGAVYNIAWCILEQVSFGLPYFLNSGGSSVRFAQDSDYYSSFPTNTFFNTSDAYTFTNTWRIPFGMNVTPDTTGMTWIIGR
jgi:PKD repeat protein